MALYWPEARFALDLMEGEAPQRSESEYPPGVLVLSVREEQVDDPEFLEEVRELIIRRTERFAPRRPAARRDTSDGEKGADSAGTKTEHGIPSISELFEGLVSQEEDLDEEGLGDCDDCLGRALEIGYGLASGNAPQVQLVINGCRDVIVRPGEVT